MKGKWYVMKNPMAGYIVARVQDTSKIVHSGNLEYFGEYSADKAGRQAVADRLNEEAEAETAAKLRAGIRETVQRLLEE